MMLIRTSIFEFNWIRLDKIESIVKFQRCLPNNQYKLNIKVLQQDSKLPIKLFLDNLPLSVPRIRKNVEPAASQGWYSLNV